jgi:hypothetical protein
MTCMWKLHSICGQFDLLVLHTCAFQVHNKETKKVNGRFITCMHWNLTVSCNADSMGASAVNMGASAVRPSLAKRQTSYTNLNLHKNIRAVSECRMPPICGGSGDSIVNLLANIHKLQKC